MEDCFKITKAIIPVAGYGTRRLPITKSIEKCMLPIGDRPIVDYIVQDCISAGIEDIYFVVSGEKTQLEVYYNKNEQLENYLKLNKKSDKIPLITPPNIRFHYIIQPMDGKYGTAIPISLVFKEIKDGESVAVLMGDDFIYNKDGSSELARLIKSTPDGGSSMLGVNVPADDVSRYGVLNFDADNNFVSIVEKPSKESAPSTLINVSKYIINYDLLKIIYDYSLSDINGEYYITEPINQYVKNGGQMKVVAAKGIYLDGGTLDGWLNANNVVFLKANL